MLARGRSISVARRDGSATLSAVFLGDSEGVGLGAGGGDSLLAADEKEGAGLGAGAGICTFTGGRAFTGAGAGGAISLKS